MIENLQQRFPGTIFGTKKEIITVSWINGPTVEAVRKELDEKSWTKNKDFHLQRQQTDHGGARPRRYQQPMTRGMPRIVQSLPQDLLDKLNAKAKESKKSRAFIIREAIERSLKR